MYKMFLFFSLMFKSLQSINNDKMLSILNVLFVMYVFFP